MREKRWFARAILTQAFLAGLCFVGAQAAEEPFITGLTLGTTNILAQGADDAGLRFKVHHDAVLIITSPLAYDFAVHDSHGNAMATNPDTETMPETRFFPLRQGDYTLGTTALTMTGQGVFIDAVAINGTEPDAEVTLPYSDSDPALIACFVEFVEEGDYVLVFTERYRTGRPRGSFNLHREGESRNVYYGYYPNYSSGKDGDFNTFTVDMSKVHLLPGRYYFASYQPLGSWRNDATFTLKTSFVASRDRQTREKAVRIRTAPPR